MSDTNNIMFQAALQKLRFYTNRGLLSAENLFDMPLQSKDAFSLDVLAKGVNHQLRQEAEESFVETGVNPAKAKLELQLELQLEVIKAVIAYKVEQQKAREAAAARKVERAKLVNLLGEKQDEALKTLTPEEIQKRLAELDKSA